MPGLLLTPNAKILCALSAWIFSLDVDSFDAGHIMIELHLTFKYIYRKSLRLPASTRMLRKIDDPFFEEAAPLVA